MLEKMWKVQKDFLDKVLEKEGYPSPEVYSAKVILHLHTECDELLSAIGGSWKTHAKKSKPSTPSQVLLECVDIMKLTISVAQSFGFSARDFGEAFLTKSEIVEMRFVQNEKLEELRDKSVVLVDIDGVLARYPENFLEFINNSTGSNFSVDSLVTPSDLWLQLGITPRDYERLKHEYRDRGGVRSIELIEESREFLDKISEKYEVVLITTRDPKGMERIEVDTIKWIEEKGLQHGAVVFCSPYSKAHYIKDNFSNVVAVIDDDKYEVMNLREIGLVSYLLKRPYNPDGLTYDEILGDIL